MAISVNTASTLLKHLVMGTPSTSSAGNVYLGLLTRLPDDANHCTNDATTGYQEVPTQVTGYLNGSSVTKETGYSRTLIGEAGSSAKGISNVSYFPANALWDSVNQFTYLRNSGDGIQMHNILPVGELPRKDQAGTQAQSWDVVGFGLFTAITGGTMKGYGQLVDADGYAVDTPVTLTEGSVPIFYQNGLSIIMADQPAPERN